MSNLNTIETEIATLPPNLRAEVFDFVRFVKQRHGLKVGNQVDNSQVAGETSSLFAALESAGLVGCINTNEQLSTTYKSKLDFSVKHGTHS